MGKTLFFYLISTLPSTSTYSFTPTPARKSLRTASRSTSGKTAQEAGIRFPVLITRGVYEQCVAVPPGVTGQDEAGRLWDRLCWMLRFAIIRSKPGTTRLTVALYVRNSDKRPVASHKANRHRWRG